MAFPAKTPRQKPFVTKSQPRCCFVVIHKQKSMHSPCTLLLKFLFHKGTDNLANISGNILTIFHALTKVTISDLSPILEHGSPSRIVQTSWGVFFCSDVRFCSPKYTKIYEINTWIFTLNQLLRVMLSYRYIYRFNKYENASMNSIIRE